MTKKAPKSKAPAKKPAAKKAAPVVITTTSKLEVRNGVTQPGEGSMCRKVWDTLDKLRAKGEDTTFTTAREVLKNEKMADATVRTQAQRWREFNGIKRDAKKPARKAGKAAEPAVVSAEAQTQAH
jgi:hypothetical protein